MSSRSSRPSSTTRRALIAALIGVVLPLFLIAGCSGGSAAGAKASATGALAPGATCPSTSELATLTSGAIGEAGEQAFDAGAVCDGEWAAATFTVDDVPGRVALKWDGSAWTPVLVGGTGGPCPATVKAAPDDVRAVLDC